MSLRWARVEDIPAGGLRDAARRALAEQRPRTGRSAPDTTAIPSCTPGRRRTAALGEEHAVVIDAAPVSLNEVAGLHWARRRNHVGIRALHAAATAAANGLPRFDQAAVTTRLVFSTRRVRDLGNHEPTVKAIVDGLVAAGVFDDDHDRIIVARTWLPHRVEKGCAGVEVIVRAVQDDGRVA